MRAKDICADPNLTDEEKWKLIYGTDYYGNLPQYKKDQHDGHCWMPCPYDVRADELRTRAMLKLNDTEPLPIKVDHTDSNGRAYYMTTESRGVWGFSCTFSGCTHKLSTGLSYFYR
jgi:hypothetical protein